MEIIYFISDFWETFHIFFGKFWKLYHVQLPFRLPLEKSAPFSQHDNRKWNETHHFGVYIFIEDSWWGATRECALPLDEQQQSSNLCGNREIICMRLTNFSPCWCIIRHRRLFCGYVCVTCIPNSSPTTCSFLVHLTDTKKIKQFSFECVGLFRPVFIRFKSVPWCSSLHVRAQQVHLV